MFVGKCEGEGGFAFVEDEVAENAMKQKFSDVKMNSNYAYKKLYISNL